MTQLYYTGTNAQIVAANAQINVNCGFPDANTQTWDTPKSSYADPTLWFIAMPNVDGYKNEIGSWTQAQMISGVINIVIQAYNPSWFPP